MSRGKPKGGSNLGGGPPPAPEGPTSGVHRVAPRAATAAAAAPPPEPISEPPPSAPPARPNGRTGKKRFAAKLARVSPSACLDRALGAKTSALRIRHARAGLAGGPCDVDTQAMLLRQLYLGELESGDYEAARVAAEQIVALNVLADVAHHDAARACQALDDVDGAIAHLHAAVCAAPAERRTFHLSTLGGLLYAYGRPAEAIEPLKAALRAPDASAPLLRGQLALACFAAEGDRAELDLAYHELLHDRTGEGYGRFVLGELAVARGDRRSAQVFLQAFVAKARRARPAAQAALKPELDRATASLGRMLWN